MKPIRKHLTFSNALASLALFVALGGSAYAVSAQSVGTKEMKNRAVTAAKIRNGAVTAPKIRANAVNARKIRNGSVRRNKIANGAVGRAKIANGAVGESKIADGSVGAPKIAPGAINRSKLNLNELGVLPAAEYATKAQTAATAEKAERAETAVSAGTATKATEAARVTDRRRVNFGMALGMNRTLAQNGDVSIRARCILIAGQEAVRIYGHTNSDGAVLLSGRNQFSGGPSASDFLNLSTSETNREMELTSSPHALVAHSGSGLVMDKDGKGLTYAAGDIVMGVNFFPNIDCFVTGVINAVG